MTQDTQELKDVLVPGIMAPLADGVSRVLAERGYRAVYLGEITPDDIDAGLAHIDNDICVSTVAIVGQYMRWIEAHGAESTSGLAVLAPEVCRDCRSVSMPSVLPTAFERAGYEGIEVVPFSSPETRSSAPAADAPALDAERPVIGVCGNMPVLTTNEFRHVVCDHLEESGIQVVLPPLQRIADERDFLRPALEWFREQGVTTAICILPFGCLGGHVYARGQLRTFQKEFPEIELTILDYDPSASDVNLVNRTELVIQAAREKAAR